MVAIYYPKGGGLSLSGGMWTGTGVNRRTRLLKENIFYTCIQSQKLIYAMRKSGSNSITQVAENGDAQFFRTIIPMQDSEYMLIRSHKQPASVIQPGFIGEELCVLLIYEFKVLLSTSEANLNTLILHRFLQVLKPLPPLYLGTADQRELVEGTQIQRRVSPSVDLLLRKLLHIRGINTR